MKIQIKHFFMTFLSIVTLGMSVGCGSIDTVDSTLVAPSTIHREYRVDYNASLKELKTFAQLRVGGSTGTTVRLAGADSLTVNGKRLSITDGDEETFNFIGTYYSSTERTSNPRQYYRFTHKQDGMTAEEDLVQLAPAVELRRPRNKTRYQKGNDMPLDIKGESLASDETLTVSIGSVASAGANERSSITKTFFSRYDRFVIDHEDLEKLPRGRAVIRLKRVKRFNEAASGRSEGASISSSYSSLPIDIWID